MVLIVMVKQLDGLWGTEEEFAEMSDEAILDLVHEDLTELVDDATFNVIRTNAN